MMEKIKESPRTVQRSDRKLRPVAFRSSGKEGEQNQRFYIIYMDFSSSKFYGNWFPQDFLSERSRLFIP